jgi:hypothetical protein
VDSKEQERETLPVSSEKDTCCILKLYAKYVAQAGASVTALSLLDSNPVSSPGVGADRNEKGRHTSSAAAAHPSRTPSRAGSPLLCILPILSTHSSSLLLGYLRKGQGFAEVFAFAWDGKDNSGPRLCGSGDGEGTGCR